MRREPEDISYLELTTAPTAPRSARHQARAALTAWQLPPDLTATAELLVSELVTNASQAATNGLPGIPPGTDEITLTLRLLPGRLVIEVFDHHPAPPVLTHAGPDAETGRGLLLVQALSKEWGHYYPPAGGKTVYAIIPAEPQPAPSP